jgi:hypothetical protein
MLSSLERKAFSEAGGQLVDAALSSLHWTCMYSKVCNTGYDQERKFLYF